MKLPAVALLTVLTAPPSSVAFVTRPATTFLDKISIHAPLSSQQARVATPLSMAIDPSSFQDIHHHIPAIQDAFSSFLLSDEAVADIAGAAAEVATNVAGAATDVGSAVTNVAGAATNVAGAATDVAGAATDAAATGSDNGWFGFLTAPIEFLLQVIHSVLNGVGVNSNSWGAAIILMTFIIKVGTYPLTKNQMESTTKMQTMQPLVKDIQAKYQSNPEVMNQKISQLYQEENVNPLAGCLPAIVQLPVFIGLYRAVLELAKNNELNEPFLWLPNLEGPVYGADPAHGSDWILKGWNGLEPSLGWPDTLAFLTLPVILVISQLISQEIMQPKNPDGSQVETNAVLKFLPFLIGWFSLNVPAALGVYWVINNVVTTAISMQIKASVGTPTMSGSGGAAVMDATPKATFTPTPMREKPSGFAPPSVSGDEITPITPIDAEVVSVATDEEVVPDVFEASGDGMSQPKSKKGKKRGKKRKKN